MTHKSDVEIDVKVVRTTERALLVNFGAPDAVWIPKSQISDYGGSEDLDEDVDCIFIPEWLAKEKGMI